MSSHVLNELRKQDHLMRKMFADSLKAEGFLSSIVNDPDVFHDMLVLAKDRNWVTPQKLHDKLNHDYSIQHIRRWFESDKLKRSTPKIAVIKMVMESLVRIIEESDTLPTGKKTAIKTSNNKNRQVAY